MKTTSGLLLLLAVITGCGVAESDAAAGADPVLVPGAEQVELRRMYAGSELNLYAAEPSPDGRHLSEIDWNSGDLALLDLATGQLERITDKGSWRDSVDYAEYSTWSPDGTRLAYSWFSESARGYELREIGVDGTGIRTLLPAPPDGLYTAAEHWSPDGSMVAVTIARTDGSSQLATVSVADGSVRVLKTSDWRIPRVAAFSPDSRHLAYDFQPDPEGGPRDIFLMAVDGSRETRLVGGPSNDVLLGWLPDGSGILFYSNRNHTRAVWRQGVEEGRPVGSPELVRADLWNLAPLGFTRDAYFYGVTVEMPQVHTATIDLTGDRVVVPPAPVNPAHDGGTQDGAWSRDGRYFAYLHARQADRGRIVIRSVGGEERREIPVSVRQARRLQWHPDGESFLVVGDVEGREGLHRIDVRTGEVSLFFPASPDAGPVRGRIGPDGRTLYATLPAGEELGFDKNWQVTAVDVETGTKRPLHEIRTPGQIFFSPDGQRYAVRQWHVDEERYSVLVGHTDGTGELRTVYTTEGRIDQSRGHLPWTPDGTHVLVPVQVEDERSHLVKVPVDGGEPVVLLEVDGLIFHLELSPDGRHISFTSGRFFAEVWRMDGLAGLGQTAAAGASR